MLTINLTQTFWSPSRKIKKPQILICLIFLKLIILPTSQKNPKTSPHASPPVIYLFSDILMEEKQFSEQRSCVVLNNLLWWSVISVKVDCVQLPTKISACAEQYARIHTHTLTKIQIYLCPVHQVVINSSVLVQAVLLWNPKQPEKGFYMKYMCIQYSNAFHKAQLA